MIFFIPDRARRETVDEVIFTGVGQFGEFFACQCGEWLKTVKVANFFEGCQSGDTAKVVKVANRD